MADYSGLATSEQENRRDDDELFRRIKANSASVSRLVDLPTRPRRSRVLKAWDTGDFASYEDREDARNAAKQRVYRAKKRKADATPPPSLTPYVPGDEDMVACEIMVASWHAQGSPQARQVRPSDFPQIAAHVAILIHLRAEAGRLPSLAAYASALTAGTGQAFDRHRARNVLRRVQAILDADDVSSRGVKT